MSRQTVLWCLPVVAAAVTHAAAADWPTYRHDNFRTARTTERIKTDNLGLVWVWRSPHPPRPAWAGAAAVDAYHGIRNLPDMRDYDHAFYVAAAGGMAYFGSSVDDSVRCLDAASGKEKWRFTTDAPVRVAPTVANGKVYFGSDDGYAYCVSAADGKLVWKYSPVPGERRVLNNGSAIAVRPCRTGVLVDKGTAYCAFSMLPWERTYLCALDAATGKPTGKGRFVRVYETFALEAPFVATADRLFMPQGRSAGVIFARADGKDVGHFGPGGSFVALSVSGKHVLGGPGTRAWGLGGIRGARDIILDGQTTYAVTHRNLGVLTGSGRQRAARFNKPLVDGRSVMLADQTVFAGSGNRASAFAVADGKELWSFPVTGTARGLAVADGRLFVSTDEGHIYCFAPGGRPAKVPHAAKPRPMGPADPSPIHLPTGPYAQFTAPDRAVVRWTTAEPSSTIIEYGTGNHYRKIEDPKKKTHHAATLEGLKRKPGYRYVIRATVAGKLRSTGVFGLDTFFNYTRPAVPDGPAPFGKDNSADMTAKKVLAATQASEGVCVILGRRPGGLAYELARKSGLRIIGFDTDAHAVVAGRKALMPTGAYGVRISLHHVPSLDEVPLVGGAANVVIIGQSAAATGEAVRLLRPGGTALFVASRERDGLARRLKAAGLDVKTVKVNEGSWLCAGKPQRKDIGVWSHQYGRADNATYGGEALAGAQTTRELGVQWLGRPGPRYQPDRAPRKPAPLAVGGRLFGQGLRRIVALDAHNGVILWSLEIPDLIRMNIPDDCGNWCADENHVFAAVKDRCWQIDAATGQVVRTIKVVPGEQKLAYEWGYVGREQSKAGPRLVGSAIRAGSTAKNYWGRGGWYDDASSRKVCSYNLFAVDPTTGRTVWTYRKGVIINSTITLTPSRAYFIESRGGGIWAEQFIVALDLTTGRVVWATPFKCPGKSIVYHLAWGEDRLILHANAGWTYHVYAFDATDAGKGKQKWLVKFGGRGDHGAHMARQAIVDGKVFARPKIIELASGKVLGDMPGGGCGTYSFSRHAAFFRANHTTMWSFTSHEGSNFYRLRPDCWLSTVPACGLLLSPEASGGCICGNWLETSIAFAPKTDLAVFDSVDLQFTGQLDVKIRKPLDGGRVHYTLDNSRPTARSPKLTGPIRLTKTTVVRACLVRSGQAGKDVTRRFEKIRSKIATALIVNFQPPGAVPKGCVADVGEPFSVRPNGYAYGWSRPMKQAVRRRRRVSDPKRDTQIYFMPGISWSIAVKNGTYDVTVCIGDAAYGVSDGTVYVNGVELCKGARAGAEQFKTFTKQVKVTDGRLTMKSHQKAAPNERTRINYIEFKKK